MPSSPLPPILFATASLARRIEHAEASLIEQLTTSAGVRDGDDVLCRHIAGGVATYAGAGSPANKIAGLGFEGVPSSDELDEVERQFARRSAPVQAEVASLGNLEIPALLTARGYRLVGFENVLGLILDRERLAGLISRGDDPQTVVSRIADGEGAIWLDTVATGSLTPDVFDGPASHESFPRDVIERAFGDMTGVSGYEQFLARREGAVAGAAGLRLCEGVAQLCGAATLPAHRRRGVQSALLRTRLTWAADGGADIAIVTTLPGSKSQENAQRTGFSLLYTRAILVKAPPPQ